MNGMDISRINGLDLFSGIGGISLALRPWVRTVAYCEIDPYCQGVLKSAMRREIIDPAGIWDDVRTLRESDLGEPIDIISGGFPCQDISTAGTGNGLDGESSGLFFELLRLGREIRPPFIFLENVPAVTFRGLNRVCGELSAIGYDCAWTLVSAAELGAPHIRKRWWLLAHLASIGCDRRGRPTWARRDESADGDWWSAEPRVGRMVHGLPLRSHRIRALGNAVVPQCAREAFQRLIGMRASEDD